VHRFDRRINVQITYVRVLQQTFHCQDQFLSDPCSQQKTSYRLLGNPVSKRAAGCGGIGQVVLVGVSDTKSTANFLYSFRMTVFLLVGWLPSTSKLCLTPDKLRDNFFFRSLDHFLDTFSSRLSLYDARLFLSSCTCLHFFFFFFASASASLLPLTH
jgi:hypothetical protein